MGILKSKRLLLEKYYYSYSEFVGDIALLAKKVEEYKPDTLVAIARGGLTLGHFLAQALERRRLFTLSSIHYEKEQKLESVDILNIPDLSGAKRVLLIDDIVDSGETLQAVVSRLKKHYPKCEFKIATLFYKTTALIEADYTLKRADKWIEFFWEVDGLKG